MTEQQLREIEAKCAAATPGPWSAFSSGREELHNVCHYVETGDGRLIVAEANGADTDRGANAAFLAAARADVPLLVGEVRRLRAALTEVIRFDDEGTVDTYRAMIAAARAALGEG